MKVALLAPLALAGCASHTAQIAASANDARAALGSARGHLVAALGDIDSAEQAATTVSAQVGFVSDEVSPIWTTVQVASGAVALAAIAVVVYILKK